MLVRFAIVAFGLALATSEARADGDTSRTRAIDRDVFDGETPGPVISAKRKIDREVFDQGARPLAIDRDVFDEPSRRAPIERNVYDELKPTIDRDVFDPPTRAIELHAPAPTRTIDRDVFDQRP